MYKSTFFVFENFEKYFLNVSSWKDKRLWLFREKVYYKKVGWFVKTLYLLIIINYVFRRIHLWVKIRFTWSLYSKIFIFYSFGSLRLDCFISHKRKTYKERYFYAFFIVFLYIFCYKYFIFSFSSILSARLFSWNVDFEIQLDTIWQFSKSDFVETW